MQRIKRADRRKYHYIYKITRDDGRFYIGMHSTDNLDDGYFGSGKLITRSIKKHGLGKHTKEILEFLPCRLTLKEREAELLTEELRTRNLCMNIAPGGSGGFISVENQFARSSAGGKAAWAKEFMYATVCAIQSNRFKKLHAEGKLRHDGFKNKNHSAETKTQIAKTREERKCGLGEKNSQFGTKWAWLHKDGVRKKVRLEQVQEYFDAGWHRKHRGVK